MLEGIDKLARRGGLELQHQTISADDKLLLRVTGFSPHNNDTERIWLAAPKVTDALYIAAQGAPIGLALHRLPAATDEAVLDVTSWLGVRAAALSASFIFVNLAAMRLDIDPEEFDVLEPRPLPRQRTSSNAAHHGSPREWSWLLRLAVTARGRGAASGQPHFVYSVAVRSLPVVSVSPQRTYWMRYFLLSLFEALRQSVLPWPAGLAVGSVVSSVHGRSSS